MTQGMTPENFCYWLKGALEAQEGCKIRASLISEVYEKLTAALTDKVTIKSDKIFSPADIKVLGYAGPLPQPDPLIND